MQKVYYYLERAAKLRQVRVQEGGGDRDQTRSELDFVQFGLLSLRRWASTMHFRAHVLNIVQSRAEKKRVLRFLRCRRTILDRLQADVLPF